MESMVRSGHQGVHVAEIKVGIKSVLITRYSMLVEESNETQSANLEIDFGVLYYFRVGQALINIEPSLVGGIKLCDPAIFVLLSYALCKVADLSLC